MKNKKRLFISLLLSLMLFSTIQKPFISLQKPPATIYNTTPPSTEPGGDELNND